MYTNRKRCSRTLITSKKLCFNSYIQR